MRPFTILTVCTANICRSPVIEILLRQLLDPDQFVVRSAGVQGWRNAPVDSMVVLELERLGARADGFVSRVLEDEMVDDADLILTATREHRAEVLSRCPGALRRTFTLLEFAGLVDGVEATSPRELVASAYRRRSDARDDADLPDPFRGPPAVHRAVADEIALAVATTADRLAAAAK
jgi:protein-tyrosine phosphatase